MTTLVKAREPHVSQYDGLYPLGYWVQILVAGGRDVKSCAVEDLRGHWSRPDPVWEVRAPAGYRFGCGEGTHSLLCYTLQDVRDRCDGMELVPCIEGDYCGCEYAAGEMALVAIG